MTEVFTLRHCHMFHILHGAKTGFYIQYFLHSLAQNCSLPQPFPKKKKRGHFWSSRAALSVISIFPSPAACAILPECIVVLTVVGFFVQRSWLIHVEFQTSSPHCVAALNHGFSKSGRHHVHMWSGPDNCITAGARRMDNSVLCMCSLRP